MNSINTINKKLCKLVEGGSFIKVCLIYIIAVIYLDLFIGISTENLWTELKNSRKNNI